MKKVIVLLLACLVAGTAAAEVKAVPGEVMAWYKDMMSVYAELVKSLDAANNAATTAAAFDKAAQGITAKNLGPRYKELKKQYPRFFEDSESSGTDWVPPADWIPVFQSYSETLARYGQGMQKAMAHAQDPAVAKALKAFSKAMKDFN